MDDICSAYERFLLFSPGDPAEIRVFFAPGRVNLIGEHVDYNGGYVFPAALTQGTLAFVRPRRDGWLRIASTAFTHTVRVHVEHLKYEKEDEYANYPKGAIWALQQEGVVFSGADMLLHGDIPNGAGLSSSASVEVVTVAAASALAGAHITERRIAVLAQRAENEFVGVNCGIMDQFAVALGKAGHALLLDCQSLQVRQVPVPVSDYRIVIANSHKRRELTDSKYNERRAECETALAELKRLDPALTYLVQLPENEWQQHKRVISDETLRKRAQHVIAEHNRVLRAVHELEAGNIYAFGQLLSESHISLRDDYEVTGSELDELVAAAWQVEGCIGSRMTGAGFGGCSVSLVHKDATERFQSQVGEGYHRATGLTATFMVSQFGDGVREVTKEVFAACQRW